MSVPAYQMHRPVSRPMRQALQNRISGARTRSGFKPNYAGLASGAARMFPKSPIGGALGQLGGALGVYQGLQQGGVQGNLGALAGASRLAGASGLAGEYSKGLSGFGSNLGGALGIYGGIKQGGWQGDTRAAMGATQLASNAGLLSKGLGQYAGYAAIPLAAYNFVQNDTASGRTGDDALGGAETGAEIGTAIVPGIGTVVGGLIGGAAGALASAFGPGAKDPEQYNWGNYVTAYDQANKTGHGADMASQVTNPYLPLAGLFDLRSGQIGGNIPMYDQYGRMGESKFTTDMTGQIQNAMNKGTVTKGEDPNKVYSSVIAPWINSFGKGANTDVNAGAMQSLLTDMAGQYMSGQAGQAWKDVDQGTPFANLPGQIMPPPPAPIRGGLRNPNVKMASKGGYMNRDKMLQDIYKGSYTDRLQHFDSGGSYYGNYANYSNYSSYPSYITPSLNQSNYAYDPGASSDPYAPGPIQAQDPSSLQNIPPPDPTLSLTPADLAYINAGGGPGGSGSSSSAGNQGITPSSQLAGLLQSLGLGSKTAGNISSLLPLLPFLSALGGVGRAATPESLPGLPSQYTGKAANYGVPSFNRTANPTLQGMSQQDWLHSAEQSGGIPQFYRNNALPQVTPGPQAYGGHIGHYAWGGRPRPPTPMLGTGPIMPHRPMPMRQPMPIRQPMPMGRPIMRQPMPMPMPHPLQGGIPSGLQGGVSPSLQGGVSPSLQGGIPPRAMMRPMPMPMGPMTRARGGYTNPGYVSGPGNGTSDDINAKLSDGEYVIDAPTVSLLGNGSNDAGARALDHMRINARRHAGKKLARGKQPMHALAPEQYMDRE